jgi:hypothetical protein
MRLFKLCVYVSIDLQVSVLPDQPRFFTTHQLDLISGFVCLLGGGQDLSALRPRLHHSRHRQTIDVINLSIPPLKANRDGNQARAVSLRINFQLIFSQTFYRRLKCTLKLNEKGLIINIFQLQQFFSSQIICVCVTTTLL